MTGRTRGDAPGERWSRRRARRVAVGWIALVVLASVVDPAVVFGSVDAPANVPAAAGSGGSFGVDAFALTYPDAFALSHLVAYGVLGWLVADGVGRETEPAGRNAIGTAAVAVAVAAAVGLGVELLQAPLAARTASAADAVLNVFGATAGVGARALLRRR